MIIKEAKKISKIVDELFLYFIKHGHANINFDVNVTKEDITIDIKLKDLEEKLIEKLTERIGQKRELEVEEYGWELMGESDCSNELELIGLLIDSFNHTKEGNVSTLSFRRLRR